MTELLEWVEPSGQATPLSTGDVQVVRGLQGRGMPPIEYADEQVAGRGGSRLVDVRHGTPEVAVPLRVRGASSRAEARQVVRQWARRFDPVRGDGAIRSTLGGQSRRLNCRYVGGMELDETSLPMAAGMAQFVAVFRAFDPYWEDAVARTNALQVEALAFLSPDSQTAWYPWQVVDAGIAGGFNINNPGDVDAWPVWTVQGPGGPVIVSNNTTGQVLEVGVSLASGQQVRIDTRPDRKTVTGPGGSNAWPLVSDQSELWPLRRGSQLITVFMDGSVPGETQVLLEWRARWLST